MASGRSFAARPAASPARPPRPARGALLFGAGALLALLAACAGEPEPSGDGTLCGAAAGSTTTCERPSDCDAALASSCARLEAALSTSSLASVQDCLESGVCGPSACLARAQKRAKPTRSHVLLAEGFCAACAPGVEACEEQFYARKSGLPGGLVLPYAASVAAAVHRECATDQDTCRSGFAACATGVIERVVTGALDRAAAECVLAAFASDGAGEGEGPGGGPEVATCSPDDCAGCCRDGVCHDGASEAACGLGGAACETCGGAQACELGKCKEPCGPTNCAGCCDGDTCVPGTASAQCGSDGAACASCADVGSSFVCSNSTCIDASCQATCTSGCCTAQGCKPGTAASACGSGGAACVDCGYGRTCSPQRTCALSPTSLWDFYVSFAVVPDTNKKGASWDPLKGLPDPYLLAFSSEGSSSHTGRTAERPDTTTPFWAETPLVGVKASELLNNLSFEIWDSDYDFDDFIGGCRLPLVPADFDGSLKSHVCPPTASTVSVELHYRLNPRK